jgi:hypothetical protein
MLEYIDAKDLSSATSKATMIQLGLQFEAHIMWRMAFYKGTGERSSENKVLLRALSMSTGQSQVYIRLYSCIYMHAYLHIYIYIYVYEDT